MEADEYIALFLQAGDGVSCGGVFPSSESKRIVWSNIENPESNFHSYTSPDPSLS